MIKTGYFLITDISGYTQFLTQSELEHANEIIQSLFKAQASNIRNPFKISRYQGDAIQTYAEADQLLRPQMILEMVEKIYFEFKDHVRQADYNTTCTCNACSNIKNLDLKIIVHHGDFLVQSMGDREELQGRDVIVAHRLEKNSIVESYNIGAYAIFSKAAVEAAKMEEIAKTMIEHSEEYEHVGEVPIYVYDLNAAWQNEQNRRKAVIEKEGAWVYSQVEVPVPQPIAWERMVDADSKIKYIGLNTLSETNQLVGRVGNETAYHCSHDAGEFKYTIIDWSPFSYFTSNDRFFGVKTQKTYRLTELGKNRTRFEITMALPKTDDPSINMEELQIGCQGLMDATTHSYANYIEELLENHEIVLDNE